jgi:hypothetical protein
MAGIQSPTTGTAAEVDATAKSLRVMQTNDDGSPLAASLLEVVAPSDRHTTVGGINDLNYRPFRADRMGNIGTTRHSPLFNGTYDGATVNGSQFSNVATTQTVTQTTSFGASLNANNTLAANTSATLISLKHFPFFARAPILMRKRIRLIKGGTNGIAEFGFGNPNGNTPLAIGAVWQYGADGTFKPVLFFNGTAVTGNNVASLIDNTKYHWFDIIVSDDVVTFSIQDPSTRLIINEQTIPIGQDAARMFAAMRLPVFDRTYVGGIIATAPATQLFVGQTYVGMIDADLNRPITELQASLGNDLFRNPQTGVQLPVHTNNTAGAALTLSNTIPGATTPGGRFAIAATAGAVTDYALFSYQVPVGYQLIVTDVSIDLYNDVIASAAQHVLEWSVAHDATAASLAAGTQIREFIGMQTLANAAPVGSVIGPPIRHTPRIGRKTDSGRFLTIILRIPVGTATATQLFRGAVNISGYFSE